jgi:hypothetical protein
MEALDPFPPSDPVGEALHFLRMNGAFYCRSELTAQWGLTLPPMPGYIWFHVVTSGRLWLETGDDEEASWIQPGDLALVPHGEGHVLRSEVGAPAPGILDLERELVSDRYEILRPGEGGAPTGLICGAVRFEHPAAENLIRTLPSLIHIEASASPRLDWMESTLRLMAAEAKELRPGGEARSLPRRHPRHPGDPLLIETDPAAHGWLGALQDRHIGRALSLIHRDPRAPDRRITGPRARDVALSLRRPLHRAQGEPVMQYVTRWRMLVAVDASARTARQWASWRGGSATAPKQPARAFKRVVGAPPEPSDAVLRPNGTAHLKPSPSRVTEAIERYRQGQTDEFSATKR